MSKGVKIFAVIIVIIAALIWMASRGSSTPDTTGPLSSTTDLMPITNTLPAQNNEFSNLLSTVSSINIDETVFSSPTFKALRDNPITLGTDTVGRSNPFAPIGADSPNDLVNPLIQTLNPGKVTSNSAEFSAQITFTTSAPVTVMFQYGPTDQFGFVTAPSILSKSGTVLATVKDLVPGTSYKVQAVAVVGSTTTNGNIMPFSTTAAPAH